MKISNITNILFYLGFQVTAVVGLLVSRFLIGPTIAMRYLFPLRPNDIHYANPFIIAMFGLSSAIPAAIVLGVALGFFGVSRPGYKAFLLGVGAPILAALYFSLVISADMVPQNQLSTWIKVVEAVVFVGVFVMSTIGVNHLAANINLTLRRIFSVIILLVFFGYFGNYWVNLRG